MINLSKAECTDCMECVSACPNYVFGLVPMSGGAQVVELRYPDQCCACGHCIAACPTDALSHPDLPHDRFEPLPPIEISPEAMKGLMFSRRSIRHYKPDPVPDGIVQTLLSVAIHAGTSSNGQSEGFILVKDRSFLQKLELLIVDILWNAGLKYLNGRGFVQSLLILQYGEEMLRQYRAYHGIFKHRREHNEIQGVVFRHAPLVIIAHGIKTNVLAQTNCALAMRNTELLAMTMGLGTCWAGFLVAAAGKSKKIGRMLDLPKDRQIYGALMLGYPKERFSSKIPRKPRDVRWI